MKSSKEKETMLKIVNSLVDSGAADEFVVAALETAFEGSIQEVKHLLSLGSNIRKELRQDLEDNLQFCRACLIVLDVFSDVSHEYKSQKEELQHLFEEAFSMKDYI